MIGICAYIHFTYSSHVLYLIYVFIFPFLVFFFFFLSPPFPLLQSRWLIFCVAARMNNLKDCLLFYIIDFDLPFINIRHVHIFHAAGAAVVHVRTHP